MSSGLHKAVSPLGITVIVVEPGKFRTDFYGRSLQQSQTVIADYAETAGHNRIENDTIEDHQSGDPARGTQLIVKAVEARNPPSLLLEAVRKVLTERHPRDLFQLATKLPLRGFKDREDMERILN